MSRARDWDRARQREAAQAPRRPGPTDAQLAYIAHLAAVAGVTITRPPESKGEASSIIDALRRRNRSARTTRGATDA